MKDKGELIKKINLLAILCLVVGILFAFTFMLKKNGVYGFVVTFVEALSAWLVLLSISEMIKQSEQRKQRSQLSKCILENIQQEYRK